MLKDGMQKNIKFKKSDHEKNSSQPKPNQTINLAVQMMKL
jgi:hypothetical protein